MQGIIVYRGPSVLDGSPIVAIATGLIRPSGNRKTGPMVQIWIMRSDVSPGAAIRSGADASVCGACPHRGAPGRNRSCYVSPQAPAAIYRTFAAGKYRALPLGACAAVLRGRSVRLGAYGDPAAVPAHVWARVLAGVSNWIGYTHQWRTDAAEGLRGLLMASCDTPADLADARSAGWRTFRVRLESEALATREVECASARGVRCIDCGACDGARRGDSDRRVSIAIVAHGSTGATNAYARLRASIDAASVVA